MIDPKKEIISVLKTAIRDLASQDQVLQALEPALERPKDENHGDYASNIAFALFKDKGLTLKDKFKTPLELAKKIVDKLNNSSLIINHCERIEAVAPGFINFWVSKEYLISQLKKVLDQGEKFGSKKEDPNKKVVVEFSSPNIAKPFTVGHLRSTIIGSAISNLLQSNGWKVYKDNHLGDWGTQFGKQIVAIKKWGDEEAISKSKNPVKELVALYVKFHQEADKDPSLEEEGRVWFKKLENGDAEAKRLWQKCVDWSLKEFQGIYEALGIEFTENKGVGYGESFFEDKMKPVIEELKKKGLSKESKGAKLVFFEKDPSAGSGQAKYPPLMILKQDGATLYATRDLAADKFRLEKYGKDIVVINEVGAEQSLYFKQLFEIEKMLGWYKEGQRVHAKHGLYKFKDEKMSTRKGNTIWLEDVLEEAQKRAINLSKDKDSSVAKAVGIGALKWNDLKRSSNLDIVFDWDEILNMEGNSGPYLQYAYARTQSVLSKCHPEFISGSPASRQASLEPEEMLNSSKRTFLSGGGAVQHDTITNEEMSLLRALNRFPEVVEQAGKSFAPNLLCNYLFDLAQKFNLFYQKHKIIAVISGDSLGVNGKHPEGVIGTQEFRVALTAAVGQVIKNGLHLLGIQAPKKM